MEEDINNPWSVENIEVFHLYCCPECEQKYSSNKIRKTQNKHLNIHSLSKFEQSVIVNLIPIYCPFGIDTTTFCSRNYWS